MRILGRAICCLLLLPAFEFVPPTPQEAFDGDVPQSRGQRERPVPQVMPDLAISVGATDNAPS